MLPPGRRNLGRVWRPHRPIGCVPPTGYDRPRAAALGRLDEAEARFRQALHIYEEFGETHEEADAWHELGTVAQLREQWQQAEEHYRRALGIYEQAGDRRAVAAVVHQLGRVAEGREQWESALARYSEALDSFMELHDAAGANVVLRSLARLWHGTGRNLDVPSDIAFVLGLSRDEAPSPATPHLWHRLIYTGALPDSPSPIKPNVSSLYLVSALY